MTVREQSSRLLPFAVVAIVLGAVFEAVFQTIIAFVPRQDFYWPATLLSLLTVFIACLWHWHSAGIRPSFADRSMFAAAVALGSVVLTALVGVGLMIEEGLPFTAHSFLLLAGLQGQILEDASDPPGIALLTIFYFAWEFVIVSFGAWVTTRNLAY